MSRANVNAYAASTAFFLFLSLIPMVMLICSIIPYTPLKESDLTKVCPAFANNDFSPAVLFDCEHL